MGLFDFLKKKPAESASTPTPASTPSSTPTPALGTPETEASKPAGGPRYQRPSFASQAPPAITPVSSAGIPAMPPPPPMPEQIQPPFEPANRLEEAIILAVQDPQYRPAFYHELLQAELLVLTAQAEDTPTGEVQIEEGTEVQLQVLHDGRIPVFSSEDRITEGGTPAESVHFLRIRGEAFFRMTTGAECVLNPFSPFGKLLVAPEIEDLLSGRLFGPSSPEGAPEGPQVQLTQPENMPEGMREALHKFGEEHEQIIVLYAAQVSLVNQDEVPPRLMLAFGVEGEDMEFLQELGPVLQGFMEGTESVDVVRLSPDPNEPLSQYFMQQDPIFLRAGDQEENEEEVEE